MEIIKLKGNTNRGIHYLSPVTPVEEHPDERWYKFITQYPYRIFNDIKTNLFISSLIFSPIFTDLLKSL